MKLNASSRLLSNLSFAVSALCATEAVQAQAVVADPHAGPPRRRSGLHATPGRAASPEAARSREGRPRAFDRRPQDAHRDRGAALQGAKARRGLSGPHEGAGPHRREDRRRRQCDRRAQGHRQRAQAADLGAPRHGVPGRHRRQGKERDGKLHAPGISDDTRGLAVLLSWLKVLNDNKVQTVGDLVFVGNVGEEELGNLRGMKPSLPSTSTSTAWSAWSPRPTARC